MKKRIIIIILAVIFIMILVLAIVKGTLFSKGRINGTQGTEAEESVTEETITESIDGTQAGEVIETIIESETNVDDVAPTNSGSLSVSGTQLVDANGKPIQLRGISTHGLSWYPQYVNEELFRQFRDEWNANLIRLAMYTADYGGYCTGGDKEQLKQLIRNGVEYATNLDMYVIIDWHILSDGNPNTYKNEAIAFFNEMSSAYASYDNVIYEICNEPNGGTTWSEIKAYANEVIPVIRANDADAVILVGTPNWCQYINDAAADPLEGFDNIMYTLHFYAASHTDWLRNDMVSAIGQGLPVFVSEYGICDASGNGAIDEAQADAWVELMNQYGISHVAWNISNKNESSAIFQSTCNKISGFSQDDLSESGKWLYQMLTKDGGGMPQTIPDKPIDTSDNTGNTNAPTHTITGSDIGITATLVNSWESGNEHCYQYALTLQNNSNQAIDTWSVELLFNENIAFSDGWNGNYTAGESSLAITSKEYNGRMEAGMVVSDIGFIVKGSSNLKLQ